MNVTQKSVLNIEGNIELFKKNLKNKTVCVCLQGKSIEELEKRIKDFKDLDICWAGQNRYDCIQDNILNKIEENFKVVLDIATVKHNDDYDKFLRIPRVEKILKKNPEISILITHKVLNNMFKVNDSICINPKTNFIYLDIENCNFSIPNSLTLYLLLLIKYGAKRIILFGFDGFGRKEAFIDPYLIGNMKDFKSHIEIATYYMPEIVKKDRRIGFGTEEMSGLFSDSPSFNNQFLGIYEKYCKDNDIEPIKIYNCNPNSMFTLFEKIDYNRALELCKI